MTPPLAPVQQTQLSPLEGWRAVPRRPSGHEDSCLIIATYQRPAEVRRLISRLGEMPDVPTEVLIVDGSPGNESERALVEFLAEHSLPFELVYVGSPKGLTRQRNVGVDISTKSILFFLDDDALPLPGYFSELRRVLVEDLNETIGAAGACIVNEIDKPIPRRWWIRRAVGLIPRTEPLIYNDVGTSAPGGLMRPFSGVRDVDIFAGGACAIRRKVLESVRFSEFFDGYSWGEDLEMSLRIRRRWRVVYCGKALALHYGGNSPGGRPAAFTRGRMEVRNRVFIWRRYSPSASLLNKIRFCLDLLFIFLLDLAWFVARPWDGYCLSHARGLATGALSCLESPPEWDEGAALPRYRLIEIRNTDWQNQCCR